MEKVSLFENFISKDECCEIIQECSKLPILSYNQNKKDFYRTDVTQCAFVEKMRKFLQVKLNKNIECKLAIFQVRYPGARCDLHVHRPEKPDYNSILYLNDDFEGGVFYTEGGFRHVPKPGDVLFFNGKEIWHGVELIGKAKRYAINFWWDIV